MKISHFDLIALNALLTPKLFDIPAGLIPDITVEESVSPSSIPRKPIH